MLSSRQQSQLNQQGQITPDARLDSIDITSVKSLAQFQFAPLSARLNVGKLDFGELKQFVGSPIKFLEREIAGQIDIKGRFRIDGCAQRDAAYRRHFGEDCGYLTNLHHPQDLELDLACVRNKIDPDDVRQLMPTLRIPDLSRSALWSTTFGSKASRPPSTSG